MKFIISKEFFDKVENGCFGVVAVKELDNKILKPEIAQFLNENIAGCENYFDGKKVKEAPEIVCYREAFRSLGINPNKFLCSIEALLSRIAKKKGFPSINPAVDLGNAVSIKYYLPIGAHDINSLKDDGLYVRPAYDGDTFVAFGGTEKEFPAENEIVYVSGNEVRTRNWTWRQSEIGKITEETTSILFPIDGFTDVNKDKVIAARDELADLLKRYFNCEVIKGFLDKDDREFEIKF